MKLETEISSRSHSGRARPTQKRTPYLGPNSLAGMPIQCQYCSGQTFRRSSLRSDDFYQMLLMRYPVRCLRCSQRQMVSFAIAGVSLSSKIRPKRQARSTATNWTEPAGESGTRAPAEQETVNNQ